MERDVQSLEAIDGLGNVLIAGHFDPPAAEDANESMDLKVVSYGFANYAPG